MLTCIHRAACRPKYTPPALRLARPISPQCRLCLYLRPQDARCDSNASSSRWKVRTTVNSRSGVGFHEELSLHTEERVVEPAPVVDNRDPREASRYSRHHMSFCVGGNTSFGGYFKLRSLKQVFGKPWGMWQGCMYSRLGLWSFWGPCKEFGCLHLAKITHNIVST